MNHRKLLLYPTFIVMLAVLCGFILTGCSGGGQASDTSGGSGSKVAPDFSVRTITGDTVTLASLRGKPIVLNFAASWCGPCEVEAPVLEKMYEKYKDRVNFFGLAVKDQLEDQKTFAQRHGLQFPIGLDPDSKVLSNYQKAGKVNMSGIPTTFFIDANGNIAAFFIGPISESTFDQRVSTILN